MEMGSTTKTHPRVIRAEMVQGTAVTNDKSQSLGKIRDIVLDKLNGRVRYAVLEYGGFLGLGSKLFALPWELLSYDSSADAYVVNLDEATLKAAPGFDPDHWPDMDIPAFDSNLRNHYHLSVNAPPELGSATATAGWVNLQVPTVTAGTITAGTITPAPGTPAPGTPAPGTTDQK